jgi:hypothetical protein
MTMIHRVRWSLKTSEKHRKFVAERLIALKAALRAQIPDNTSETSMRLATWNLMHFGDGGAYDRTEESMLNIAEIIDHFDLVAVQEVNRNLAKLEDLMNNYLGNDWAYLVTDTAGGHGDHTDAGNNERLAFLYRKAKIHFRCETGEIVLPTGQEIAAPNGSGGTRPVQFARTPFTVAFRASWLKFKLCTVHILYGSANENSPEMKQRKAEIRKIAQFLAARQEHERKAAIAAAKEAGWSNYKEAGWAANFVLLGDFNIISPQHGTMKALEEAGFSLGSHSNTDLGNNHCYDQIVYKAAHPDFEVIASDAFDMLKYVYRNEDAEHYIDVAKIERLTADGRDRDRAISYFKRYYRRNQMSDHKLLWCEIAIDYSTDYLQQVVKG